MHIDLDFDFFNRFDVVCVAGFGSLHKLAEAGDNACRDETAENECENLVYQIHWFRRCPFFTASVKKLPATLPKKLSIIDVFPIKKVRDSLASFQKESTMTSN